MNKPLGRMLGDFGDKDPIEYGGGRIFDTEYGPFFEYTIGAETDGEVLEVYRVHIHTDVFEQYSHLLSIEKNLEDMCKCIGVSTSNWKRRAKGRLVVKAQCIVDIANFFGWESIDEDPLLLSKAELDRRWYSKFDLGEPIATESRNPSEVIPGMLLALCSLNKVQYEKLFSGPFPLIPSEAAQDFENPWWTQHGEAALAKVVALLEQEAPVGFLFSVEEGEYGFRAVDVS